MTVKYDLTCRSSIDNALTLEQAVIAGDYAVMNSDMGEFSATEHTDRQSAALFNHLAYHTLSHILMHFEVIMLPKANVCISLVSVRPSVCHSVTSLGPFYGAIAVPSATRCRCPCRGHLRRRRPTVAAGHSSDTW